MTKNQDGTFTATSLDVLASFRDMRNGGLFAIQDGTFFSINRYMFEQVKDGAIESITFKQEGMMPASNDANNNPRPDTNASVIIAVKLSKTGERIVNIRDLKLQVEEKKVQKELKEIDL